MFTRLIEAIDNLLRGFAGKAREAEEKSKREFSSEFLRALQADLEQERKLVEQTDLPRDEESLLAILQIGRRVLARLDEIQADSELREDLRELAQEGSVKDRFIKEQLLNDGELEKNLAMRRGELDRLHTSTARLVTRQRAGRSRAERHREVEGVVQFQPNDQPVFDEDAGSNLNARSLLQHHDVLLIAPEGVHSEQEFYRFPVKKTAKGDTKPAGGYEDAPELIDAYDYAQRKVIAVARPQDWGPDEFRATERGPAFVTLPVKPEPAATSCATCYLINTRNLNFRNCWTAEEWSDMPGGPDLPPAPGVSETTIDALLAGPRGKVFRLNLQNIDRWPLGTQAKLKLHQAGEREPLAVGHVESIDLRSQMEVWNQLRNGAVMGRVLFDDAGERKVIPLVNITTLTPE